jgi:hypothetical protein
MCSPIGEACSEAALAPISKALFVARTVLWHRAATGEEQLPVLRVDHPTRTLCPKDVDLHEVAVHEPEQGLVHRG